MILKALQVVGFLFILICNEVYSQKVLTGTVIDYKANEPIPFVHIFNEAKGIGATTNTNGEFNLILPDSIQELELTFSHVGYDIYTTVLNHRKSTSIVLSPGNVFLEEIVVSALDPYKIFRKCVEQIPLNYPEDDFMITGFQREVITSDMEYVQLVESQYESNFENGQTTTKLLNGRFAENKTFRIKDKLWNDKRGGFYVFGITALGGHNAPFHKSILGINMKKFDQIEKYYIFNYSGSVELGTGEAYIVNFRPKKNIKKPLIEGTMYIDSKTFALVEIRYKIQEKSKKYLNVNHSWQGDRVSTSPLSKKIQIRDESKVVKYRPYAGKWFLSSIVQDIELTAAIKLPFKTIAKSTILNMHLEQIVSNIKQGSSPFIDEDVPTEMYYYQVYLKNNSENYDPNAWQQFRSIKSDVDYSQVVELLKEKNRMSR